MDSRTMKITIYRYDLEGFYTGQELVDAFGSVPVGALTAPPTLTPPQVAQWQGNSWVVLPDKPAPAPPPLATVPQAVTMRQARLALMAAGKLTTVNTAVATMPGAQGEAARIEWEFSSEVKRQQPLVLALGGALGMTPNDLDNLFKLAVTL